MNTKTATGLTMLLTTVLALPVMAAPTPKKANTETSCTGSGTKYKTEVTRTSRGELSDADLRQASLLTSQVLGHVNTAARALADSNTDAAKGSLEKANTLIGIVRDILPVTDVTTVVTDASGKEVYKHTESVQDDVIVLYAGVATVDVLNEILDAKEAEPEGPEYLGSVELYTSVLADLGYIERKIHAALRDIKNPVDARAQLILAQVNGVDMTVSKAENPLLDARRALQVAEKQVGEKKYELAKNNLTMAKIKLEEYRALIGHAKDGKIKEITDQLETVKNDIEKEGVSGVLRDCWSKTVKLFEHHNARTATANEANEPPKK